LSRAQKARIAGLIAEMESLTTGEIHVHVTAHSGKLDIIELARRRFAELGLDKTDERNGVLILVSHLDHRFAIWGDEGVHAQAGQPLWDRAKEELLKRFAERRYAEGIEACVREVGRELAMRFPRHGGEPPKNRLQNEVSES
jgi:uncharacterized membrane protein